MTLTELKEKIKKIEPKEDVFMWALINDTFKRKDVYENNIYKLKHNCENTVCHYVSIDELALCYAMAGVFVEPIIDSRYAGGYTYQIG